MKLHLDTYNFKKLIKEIHAKTGIRLNVLEKDYYNRLLKNKCVIFT